MTSNQQPPSDAMHPEADPTVLSEADARAKDHVDSEDPELTQYDKSLADSFPASDPPTQP